MFTYAQLGNSGLKVSNMTLGGSLFGLHYRPGNCTEELSHQILDKYVECGGNFIDTANIYTGGQSEKIIGLWLDKNKSKRDELVVATKARLNFGNPDRVNGGSLSRKHLINAVEESLRRLRTDYIDLFYFHFWDAHTPLEESLRTIDDLVRAGKIRYLGVSNFTGCQLQKLIGMSKYMGLTPCISLQQQYSLLCRTIEWEHTRLCQDNGISILPWGPLKAGWLTGKMDRSSGGAPEGSRVHYSTVTQSPYESEPSWDLFAHDEQVWTLLDKMKEIADSKGRSVPQVALRWLLQKDGVTSIVVGSKTLAQLEDNMAAFNGWNLTEEEMTSLDNLSQRPLPYPYRLINR